MPVSLCLFLSFPQSLIQAFLKRAASLATNVPLPPPRPPPKAMTQGNSRRGAGFFLRADQLPWGPSQLQQESSHQFLVCPVPPSQPHKSDSGNKACVLSRKCSFNQWIWQRRRWELAPPCGWMLRPSVTVHLRVFQISLRSTEVIQGSLFTVSHIRKGSNQHADPWHHLVVLMQDLDTVHSEELVLLR